MALYAPRWQSRKATNGTEQGADGGDEPRVAARGGAGAAHTAQPGAARAVGVNIRFRVRRHLALAHAEHARRLRSSTRAVFFLECLLAPSLSCTCKITTEAPTTLSFAQHRHINKSKGRLHIFVSQRRVLWNEVTFIARTMILKTNIRLPCSYVVIPTDCL